MPNRTRYLPVELATEGMTLAEDVKDSYQRTVLPGGARLTAENVDQLVAHEVDFICVTYADTRPAEAIAVDTATTAHRMLAMFEKADLTEPLMAALFNQLLMYRSA